MMNDMLKPKISIVFALLALMGCDKDDEKPSLRARIDYSTLAADTPYSTPFVDATGTTTVDLSDGNTRLKMFQALNHYSTSAVAAGTAIDGTVLKNMFSNTGDPFTDVATTTVTVDGEALNSSGLQLRDAVAASMGADDAEGIRQKMETWFSVIDLASESVGVTASRGVAGKLDKYLVDQKGLEIAQVIQKSLIGALQLDYIGNVLLDEGLNADNFSVVGDHNYTQLEHHWDEAYGLLTLNPVYLDGATDTERSTVEFGLGSYVWEYNKEGYDKIYPAFLKGRAAIVNNDREQYQALATFIRIELERAVATAAIGYLDKWKTGTTDAARAHAIGEALGFIYSLRFAYMHDVDGTFADKVWTDLIDSSPDGFWDLDAAKINAASDAIRAKFDL